MAERPLCDHTADANGSLESRNTRDRSCKPGRKSVLGSSEMRCLASEAKQDLPDDETEPRDGVLGLGGGGDGNGTWK